MISICRDLIASLVEAVLDMVDAVANLDFRVWLTVAVLVAFVNAAALWIV